MIKETVLKIFLTSGLTLTIKQCEVDLDKLLEYIRTCLTKKQIIDIEIPINHEYEVEGTEHTQKIQHHYVIPYDKISWVMIEEI